MPAGVSDPTAGIGAPPVTVARVALGFSGKPLRLRQC
jgi:hypothetical protein